MPGVSPRARGPCGGGPGAAQRAGDGARAPPQLPGLPRGLAWGRPALGVLASGGGNRTCSGPRTMAVVYSEAAPRVLRVFRKPAGVGVRGLGAAARAERRGRPGGHPERVVRRRRVAVAQTWAARRAPAQGRGSRGTWSRRRWGPGAVRVVCSGAGLHAPSRRPDRNVVPEPLPFVVLPGCLPEGRWRDACGLGRAGLGRLPRPVLGPRPSGARRRCRLSGAGCPSRRSRAAPRPPLGVSGDRVRPAERPRASPVLGVFAVFARWCAPSPSRGLDAGFCLGCEGLGRKMRSGAGWLVFPLQ